MTTPRTSRAPSLPAAWPLTLAAVAVLGTLAVACMMPFVGLAVVAAATMPRREALVTVIGVWAANQLLGFGLMGYPVDAYAIGWGLALGGGSVAAMLIAGRVLRDRALQPASFALAFLTAFVGYEALLFAFALVAGGTGTFTPAIVAQLFVNDAAWAAALMLLHLVLARAAPRVFATPLRAR